MHEKSRKHTMEIATIGKQVDYSNDKDTHTHTIIELKNFMEQHINKLNNQLDFLFRKLNETPPTQ